MRERLDILEGWKEIERALGLSRGTIIARGFPVYRGDGPGRRVQAVRDELYRHEELLLRMKPRGRPGLGRRVLAARLRARLAARLAARLRHGGRANGDK